MALSVAKISESNASVANSPASSSSSSSESDVESLERAEAFSLSVGRFRFSDLLASLSSTTQKTTQLVKETLATKSTYIAAFLLVSCCG